MYAHITRGTEELRAAQCAMRKIAAELSHSSVATFQYTRRDDHLFWQKAELDHPMCKISNPSCQKAESLPNQKVGQ